jgi:hypothetical protein
MIGAQAAPPVVAHARRGWPIAAALVALMAMIVLIQIALERRYTRFQPAQRVLYVTSPALMKRLALSFDALAADVYWIRTVQYYGSTRISSDPKKNYDLLFTLLGMTTTLDPRFNIAYRFGAILLSERFPDGPGRPDQAVELLQKGIRVQPDRWEFLHDIGFVHYWWREDYKEAASWFLRASRVPGAPEWLEPLAAATLGQGGDRATSRLLWTQIRNTAGQDWLRRAATMRLLQLTALDQVDELEAIVRRYELETNDVANSWEELIRAGYLRGSPVDPTGTPYVLDPLEGVDVAKESPLFPLRRLRSGTSLKP